ncbi:LOW QUALITY PROTEIN: protein CASC3-like [Macrobrachium nipponense]|uniref:LOW QUALITY PROTEIN: protein CASC3-like n=1 Tax=Macrobrachium nipponense TaxID=159736 RepID=UPI0030C7BF31
MAERRRRRKVQSGEDSEELSDDSDEERLPGQRKSLAGSDGGESEYESADDEELGEEEEEEDDELLIMPDGVGIGDENKQLDDDEDRKNPQYIPKKGTFYEHDDRTAAEEDVEKPPEEPTVKKEASKKKVWKEDNKWNHDKFNEFDQAPKTREELIAVYGYDIRNEEGPPRARRRRRYGRGPNKYTRNWEDLDAYAKPVRGGTVRGGGPGRGGNRSLAGSKKALYNNEEFPALNSTQQKYQGSEQDDHRSGAEHHSPKNDIQRAPGDEHLIIDNDVSKMHQQQQQMQMQHQHNLQNRNSISSPQFQDLKTDNMGGRGRGGKGRGRGAGRGLSRDQHRHIDERSANNHDMHPGGRGNRGGYQQKGPVQHQTHVDDITLDMKNVNINTQNRDERHKKSRGGGNVENRRNTVPPRLQESAAAAANLHGRGRGSNSSPGGDGSASSRPKRYSSQRQRSIPDQPVPPFQQQQGYIDPALEAGYQGGVYEGGVNPATSHTVSAPPSQLPIAGGAPHSFVPPAFTSPPTFPPEPFLGRPPAPRMFPPVTQSPHLFTGPPLGAPPVGAPQPPGPPVTGPPFIPHEINYAAHPGPQPGPHAGPLPGASPLAGPHPPQFPPFQGFTPGPVSQPGEIYSNGVTYYNTESQQQLPRNSVPLQKRPKAAIPIVPPPEREQRQDGSFSRVEGSQDDQQFADSTNVPESALQESSEMEIPAETESNPEEDQEVVIEGQVERQSEDQTATTEDVQQVESVADPKVTEEPASKSPENAAAQDKPETSIQPIESELSETLQKPEENSIDNLESKDPEKEKASEGQPVEELKTTDGSVEAS